MHSRQKNDKKTLLILLLAFILPVAIAKLFLSMDLYRAGATNNGHLISDELNYDNLSMINPKPQQWQLLYLLPPQCLSQCQARLYILQQSHIALGKDQNRVQPVIMLTDKSDRSALSQYDFPTHKANQQLQQHLSQHAYIIVDPLGSLIMSYPLVHNKESQIKQGKALVADLRKLLKLSRVG